MEIIVDIQYEQLIELIKKLPAAKVKQLKASLDEHFINKKAEKECSDFQEFLLKGPVMAAEEYAVYKQQRQHFNAWRK